jgi:hypothetical protein
VRVRTAGGQAARLNVRQKVARGAVVRVQHARRRQRRVRRARVRVRAAARRRRRRSNCKAIRSQYEHKGGCGHARGGAQLAVQREAAWRARGAA